MTTELGQPGQIIDGKYRIVRLLGTGGMGAVFEGENIRIRRRVAIKLLHGSVSSQPEVIARFEREAQASALVGSEHICEVLDLGELPDTTRYMVMEYLEGDTLAGLIKRSGRLTPQQSIPLLLQILEALGAAHAAGIIHRDLKPDNVFILPTKSGIANFVKILDFGVSKFSQLGGDAMNMTRAGAVVGTPYYMSPEQARGSSAIDQRTDVYAIGVLLYQATTGQVPYQAETFNELLFKIVLEVAPPPQIYVPDLDPDFAAIIQRAMAREPELRFQSCAQFRDAILHYQQTRAPHFPQAQRPDDPSPTRTEVIDVRGMPSGASWPGHAPSPSAPDGTMPLGPGISSVGGNGVSAPDWAGASNPSGPSMATANSWGNGSSSADGVKPKSRKGLVFGLVALAILAVGGGVAGVVMFGHPSGTTQTSQPTATTATTPPPTATTTTAAPTTTTTAAAPTTASAEPTTSAPAPSVAPTASAAETATPVAPTKPNVPGKIPVVRPPPQKPPPSHVKPPSKPSGGGDLGY